MCSYMHEGENCIQLSLVLRLALGDAGLVVKQEHYERLFPGPPDVNMSLVKELCQTQAMFNGFGKRLAVDFLHEQGLWPGMPLFAHCADDALFLAFKEGIITYMWWWASQEYWHDCVRC
ncbi:hypothetical protein V8D89_002908 [Ganoderma adspersum]